MSAKRQAVHAGMFVSLFIVSSEALSAAPELVSFATQDGGLIYANLYGTGKRAVVLAHGATFNKESWEKQAQVLAKAGFRVLAIDFRGYGNSRGPKQAKRFAAPLYLDVLAAVRYMRKAGAESVAVIGGSMGGVAAGLASAEAKPGEIDRIVFLGSDGGSKPGKIQGRELFIVARDDPGPGGQPRLVTIRDHYQKAAEPKQLVILDGAAHAQHIFATKQGERAMGEILRFLR